jgi:aryl-alcohol dehydrogenase-like predicted oxidoreductase
MMETQTLGDTGLIVSRLALGTMTFGAQADEATAASMTLAPIGTSTGCDLGLM